MGKGQILIVDDDEDLVESLSGLLYDEGFKVSSTADGREALALIRTVAPAVVLLDVWLPGMDGVETLRRIAEIDPPLRVIMVTANADIGLTSRLLAMGAVDYIPKPFDLEYLEQAVSIQLAASQD